jgi:putative hydrolase of the HAD superfamily
MGDFIAAALKIDLNDAHELQKKYYRTYGTTLAGLMAVHGVPPDEFLAYVHEIDCTVLAPQPRLDAILGQLPGRKLVFTNGSLRHAENVLDQLGLSRHFAAIYDIKAANFVPKPQMEAYQRLVDQFAIDPKQSVMFEDLARNLTAAGQLGMTTVWVREEGHSFAATPEPLEMSGIDHITDDLAGWLETRHLALTQSK